MSKVMQGLYAAKKVVVVLVFFFTMLLMKEVMDSLLPNPADIEANRRLVGGSNRIRPGAILDVEAIAEEDEMGPEVMDQEKLQQEVDDMEGDDAARNKQDVEEEMDLTRGQKATEKDQSPTISSAIKHKGASKISVKKDRLKDINSVSIFDDDEKVLEDHRQIDEDERNQATAAQQGLPAPNLGTGGELKVPNEAPTSPAAATTGLSRNFGDNYYTLFITKASKMESVQIIPSGPVFKVQVKACSDAYLVYRQKAVADEYSYHIGLGYGKQTVIWKQPPDPVTREFETPEAGYLSCDQFVTYYVKHVGAAFDIGLDGQEPFATWKDPKPFSVSSISLATPHPKQTVVWHLDVDSVGILRADTGEDYSYEQIWITTVGKEALVLQVRACRDAHVLLSDKDGTIGNAYEIAIGMADNSKTAIREDKFGPNMITEDTPDILSCDDTKAFWFKWSHHKMAVGRGTKPGSRTIISYGKQNHPAQIRSVSLSTGWGAAGKWLFNLDKDHLYPS